MLFNSRGEITLLLALLPLLIAVTITLIASSILTNEWLRLNSLCRYSLLQIQSSNAQTITKLIKLNPLAQSLRREYQIAKEALKNAPGPLKAAAAAYLASVVTRQISLRTQQLSLISKNKVSTLQKISKLKNEFQTSHQVSRPILALETYPKNSLSPDYRAKINFSHEQFMSAQFKLTIQSLLPGWLIQNYKFNFLQKLQGSCGATIEKRGEKWLPILKKDRSLLKLPFQSAF